MSWSTDYVVWRRHEWCYRNGGTALSLLMKRLVQQYIVRRLEYVYMSRVRNAGKHRDMMMANCLKKWRS
jgi:hypothetical protein